MSTRPRVASDSSLRDFAKQLIGLRDARAKLVLDGRFYRQGGTRLDAETESAASLGLSTTATSGSVTSTEEVNATPTSYTPTSPAFGGLSSSDPTIGGTYSGENGDTTLTFTAVFGGIVGSTPIGFEVRDDEGTLIEQFSGVAPPGTVYTLDNGLEFSLSSGTVQTGDSFDVDVFQTVGSAVRLDNPFDGEGDAGAGFEQGVSVTAGAFEVNGETITVNADDTLRDVLLRITASAAGVTASFDAGTETVSITNDSSGSGADVVVEKDTSGFLAAVKLAAATPVAGSDGEHDVAIGQVAALSGITTGSFSVNGTDIAVNVLKDTLEDVVARINSTVEGVTASYDVGEGKFYIESRSEDLELDDGTSGFFSGVDVEAGTYESKRGRSRTSFRNEGAFQSGLTDLIQGFRGVFEGSLAGFGAATARSARARLEAVVVEVFEKARGTADTASMRSGLGIDFRSQRGSDRTLEIDSTRLAYALRNDTGELTEFLFAEKDKDSFDGLLVAMGKELEGVLSTVETFLGPEAVGLNLDVSG